MCSSCPWDDYRASFHFQLMLISIIFLGRKVTRMAHLAASPENLAWELFAFKARKILCISYNLKGRWLNHLTPKTFNCIEDSISEVSIFLPVEVARSNLKRLQII